MGQGRIRVGLVGANPDKGWGSGVHIPALQRLPGFELVAVCTTRMESARRSAELFGARLAFDDPAALASHPEVDLVVVCVKAPEHHRLAMMALESGKHLYCEWPLAANVAQAEAMAALAERQGVKAMVGLQSRGAPALRYVRDLIGQGYIGRVVSMRLTCALPGGGARRSQEGLYVIHRANGATTLDIQGGHAIDALQFCAGGLGDLCAVIANQFPQIEVIETGERLSKDAPDQILVAGRTVEGAVTSIAINGGVVAGHGVAIDIFGERGSLAVRGEGSLNFQMAELKLFGAQTPEKTLAPLAIPAGYDPKLIPDGQMGRAPYPGVEVPRATLVNVANLHRDLEAAIREDRRPSPNFDDGLALHRLLARIEAADPHSRPTPAPEA